MTLGEGLAAAAVRALAVATLAWLCAVPFEGALRNGRSAKRSWLAAGLVLLLVMPTLITAYAWSNLIAAAAADALPAGLHVVLQSAKLIPVAVVVLLFAPAPPLGPTSGFALDLAPEGSDLARFRWRMWCWRATLGTGRRHLLAASAVFLFAFQDFELASLLMQPSWTVWLFDAQAGGLPLHESVLGALGPLAAEVVVIASGLAFFRAGTAGSGALAAPSPARPRSGWLASAILLCALGLVVAAPAAYVLQDTLPGVGAVLSDSRLLGELSVSILFAGVVAALVLTLADSIVSAARRRWWLAAVACLPGLCGALFVALAVQALFQLPGLAWLYDTPLPLILSSAVWLLPLGAVLMAVLGTAAPRPEIHAARLLRQRGLELQRRAGRSMLSVLLGRRRLCVAGILFVVMYFEVVASAVLAPVALTPASVRLYNLMHYGHSAVLSAMVMLMVGILLTVTAVVVVTRAVFLRAAHG